MRFAAWHRLLALALAGLWALLPLAGALHDAEHAHRYCAEHGAVEEAATADAPVADSEHAGWHADEALAGDSHSTCGFSFVHRLSDGASVPHPAVAEDRGLAPTASPSAPVLPDAGGLPVLARAPKASPPAA